MAFIMQDYYMTILSVSNIYTPPAIPSKLKARVHNVLFSLYLHMETKVLASTRLTKSVTFPKNGKVQPPPTAKRLFHPRSKAKNASLPIGPPQKAGPGSVCSEGLQQQSISKLRASSNSWKKYQRGGTIRAENPISENKTALIPNDMDLSKHFINSLFPNSGSQKGLCITYLHGHDALPRWGMQLHIKLMTAAVVNA